MHLLVIQQANLLDMHCLLLILIYICLHSSVAEHWSCKPGVVSSNLTGGMFYILLTCACWFIWCYSYSYIKNWYINFEIYPSQNRVSKANVVKWKVSKKGIKFLAWHIWMGGHIYICVSVYLYVCLCVCLISRKTWIKFDGMNKSWWNFQDHSNSVHVNFGQRSQISQPQNYGPGPKMTWLLKLYLLPEISSYRDMTLF